MSGTPRDVRAEAARGDLADALVRLDACGADADLIGLARSCLAAEPSTASRRGRGGPSVDGLPGRRQDRLRRRNGAGGVEAQARAEEQEKLRLVAD